MKIKQAEFKSDVWVLGAKNFNRASRIVAAQHDVEMSVGEAQGVPADWVAIRVNGAVVTAVPPSNVDFVAFDVPAAPAKEKK